jgi:hypothetical protein
MDVLRESQSITMDGHTRRAPSLARTLQAMRAIRRHAAASKSDPTGAILRRARQFG